MFSSKEEERKSWRTKCVQVSFNLYCNLGYCTIQKLCNFNTITILSQRVLLKALQSSFSGQINKKKENRQKNLKKMPVMAQWFESLDGGSENLN